MYPECCVPQGSEEPTIRKVIHMHAFSVTTV